MRRFLIFLVVLLGVAVFCQTQVVREADAGTVAGILTPLGGEYQCQYVIQSDGNQLLIADMDVELYRRPGEGGGGCGGGSGGGGGCGECGEAEDEGPGGPSGFSLEVYNNAGTKIAAASRPIRPGWERDPRLICHLIEQGSYTLKVRFVPKGESSEEEIPFLLNVSLRRVATNGNDLKLAIYESRNELPTNGKSR